MSRVWRLIVIVLATAALIMLVAVARGQRHHRGDDTGALGVTRIAVQDAPEPVAEEDRHDG